MFGIYRAREWKEGGKEGRERKNGLLRINRKEKRVKERVGVNL